MSIINSNEIGKSALNSAIYSHKLTSDDAKETIKINSFDVTKIKEKVTTSPSLLNFNTTHKPIIMEILDILDKNKDEFVVEQYKYTGFYWNGILMLRIELDKSDVKDTELHISLHRYKREKNAIEADNRIHKILMAGLAISLLIGGIMAGVSLLKRK